MVIAGHGGENRGHVPASAVTPDGDLAGQEVEPPCRFGIGEPSHRGVAILKRGRKLILGRATVIDARQGDAGASGDFPAKAVVGIEVAEHPASAM